MDAPNKSEGLGFSDDGEALGSTPFRERAVQEQKLREELLSRGTPGLQKKSPARGAESISQNPNEVKEYLRDLSSVLVTQGRNLTSFLTEQALIKDEEAEETEETEVRQASSPPIEWKGKSLESAQHSIADAVFSQLEAKRHKPKIRKLDTVVIKDIEGFGKPSVKRSEWQSRWSPGPRTPTKIEDSLPVQEVGIQDDLPMLDSVEESKDHPLASRGNSVDLVSDGSDQSSEKSAADTIEPLTITKLKLLLGPFMSQNGINFGAGSWRTIQDLSVTLMQEMSRKLSEDHGKIVVNRQNILKMLELYEIVPLNATNEDLFELCSRYLPLENLNELEMALFL